MWEGTGDTVMDVARELTLDNNGATWKTRGMGFSSTSLSTAMDYLAPPFTLSAWARTTLNSSGYRGIITRGPWTSNDSNFELGLRASSGLLGVYCYWKNNTSLQGTAVYPAGTTYADGEWRMFSAVVDADSALTLYVNGSAIGSDASNLPPTSGTFDLEVGTGVQDFIGDIDVPSIHQRNLSASELHQLYQDPHQLIRPRDEPVPILATGVAPSAAIMNQLQGSNLGADLFNGTLL